MKRFICILSVVGILVCKMSGGIVTLTNAGVAGIVSDLGSGSLITPLSSGSTVDSLSYEISGLTIDSDGTLNDTIVLTVSVSATSGGFIKADLVNSEFDYAPVETNDGGTFNELGEGITFGNISISGTSSGGLSYSLNSFAYDQVKFRRVNNDDYATIIGTTTNTTWTVGSTTAAMAAGEQAPTIAWAANPNGGPANSWNLESIDFTVDVGAVPEPTAYGALGGLVSLLFVLYRRRNR